MNTERTKAHFINNADDILICKVSVNQVPRVNDEVRFGGKGSEKYYRVSLVVFVYDEDQDRVNIGCELIN